jgi:putative acetyltransferase
LTFLLDDLSGEPTRALVARHLAGMHASSPPESVHALQIDQLRGSDVTFWSAWLGEESAGCGALKQLDSLIPALRLYESAGFVRCGPFDEYTEDPFSVFMTRAL